jgi:hypothetical protein
MSPAASVASVAFILLAHIGAAPALAQTHTEMPDMPDMPEMSDVSTSAAVRWHWGAHAVGLFTRVSPAVDGRTLSEAYLTQPTLMAGVSTADDRFSLLATSSLEGLTLERGELGQGTYGEADIDRRHPHTYRHELLGTARADLPAGLTASLSAGRGFAPFGTDDPMMRPFVRFPVNHHLSQVLERLVAIAAVARGPLTIEVGTFSGNEPVGPDDLGSIDRFADSWAARATLRPTAAWEVQASHARVTSPEEPSGHGDDQRKWSISARHDAMAGSMPVYALAEWSRTTIVNPARDEEVYATGSLLLEAAATRAAWTTAVRLERTDRPEEQRDGAFRSPWPPTDHFVIGFTRWQVASARLQRDVQLNRLRIAPYVETSLAHVTARNGFFDPQEFYGSNDLWSLSAGLRLDLGMQHDRMGRYGVALPSMHRMDAMHDMHEMDMTHTMQDTPTTRK